MVGRDLGGRGRRAVNTAYKGEYLRHQLADSGSKVLLVQGDLAERAVRVVPEVEGLDHVVVIGDGPSDFPTAKSHAVVGDVRQRPGARRSTSRRATSAPSSTPAAPPGCRRAACSATTTTRCCRRQIGTCWGRGADDVVWTPLPLFHFNALVTAVIGPLIFGGQRRDRPEVLRLELLVGDEPHRRDDHLDARHDGVPARARRRSSRDAEVRCARSEHVAATAGRGAAARGSRQHDQVAVRDRHLQRGLRTDRGLARVVAAAGGDEQAERGRGDQHRVLRRAHLRRRRQRVARATATARS